MYNFFLRETGYFIMVGYFLAHIFQSKTVIKG